MKSILLKIMGIILIFDALYSCSKGGGENPNAGAPDTGADLDNNYSLDNLTTKVAKSGKVPSYTTYGSENGLISMGDVSGCVVMASGKIKCWGYNADFQLGNTASALTNKKTPVVVDILHEPAVAVSAGYHQTCAYLISGMKCWGAQNKGVLGNQVDSAAPARIPQIVKNLGANQIKMMAIGDMHTCVLFSGTHSVSCWGQNNHFQLALPSATPFSLQAVPINLPEPIKSIATSDYTLCAVSESGNLFCWGENLSTASNPNPVLIASNVKHISSGEHSHFCYIDNDTNVNCFGSNNSSKLGYAPPSVAFTKNVRKVEHISNATAIVAGMTHTCAIINNGVSIYCWGDNSHGQLGTGELALLQSAKPLAVAGLPKAKVIDIAASDNNTCALLDNDDVYCWGNNEKPSVNATPDFLGAENPKVSYTPIKILNRRDP